MVAGIYSHDIMNALQKHLLFPQEIEAAQKKYCLTINRIHLHRSRPQATKPHRRKHHWANGRKQITKNVGMVYHTRKLHLRPIRNILHYKKHS